MLKGKPKTIFWCSGVLIVSSLFTANSHGQQSIENNIQKGVVIAGEQQPPSSLVERMQEDNVPGVSIAVLKDGKLAWAKGFGIANSKTKQEIDANTLFQAGSISKPIAALAALKIVEQGKVALDENVNNYLSGWQVESSSSNEDHSTEQNPVTLRQLLSHTAGLSVHGFPGYATGSDLPSTVEVLQGKGNTDPVEVTMTPGSEWRYSGGGYTVMQLVVEQVTGQSFADFTDQTILRPMGMTSSTFQHQLPKELKQRTSAAFDGHGKMYSVVYNDYPEKAAAGLWTTPSDILRYAAHMQEIMLGKQNGILKKTTLEQIFSKHQNNWGLAPVIFDVDDELGFGHGGKNLGFTNEFNALISKQDGVVVMANGDNAGKLIHEVMVTLSKRYNIGFTKQKVINAVAMSKQDLAVYEGDYLMLTDINYDGDFISRVRVVDDELTIINPSVDKAARLFPESRSKFVSALSGTDFSFNFDGSEVIGFTAAGRFESKKIK